MGILSGAPASPQKSLRIPAEDVVSPTTADGVRYRQLSQPLPLSLSLGTSMRSSLVLGCYFFFTAHFLACPQILIHQQASTGLTDCGLTLVPLGTEERRGVEILAHAPSSVGFPRPRGPPANPLWSHTHTDMHGGRDGRRPHLSVHDASISCVWVCLGRPPAAGCGPWQWQAYASNMGIRRKWCCCCLAGVPKPS